MKRKLFCALLLAGFYRAAVADEKLAVLQVGSDIYSNVTVTSYSATDVFFTYPGGMANAKIKKLSPVMQKYFHYDPEKAKAAELQHAAGKIKYQEQLAQQPVVHPPDISRNSNPPVARALWRSDFPGALKQAQAENKLVLLDFTGSDWCPWCIKFDQDVLSTGKFNAYADQKLELVKVDFPRHTPLPDDQRQANAALAKQFNVDGYPTYVLVTPNGKELGRQVGYQEGGPDAFTAELDKFSGR